jgi:hypothetical protein
MRSSRATTVWIFERLGLDVALAGDLLEERARGRSAIWYWRQVLIAIWIDIWVAIRDHKVLAVRAVAMGVAINYLFNFLWWRYLYPLLSPMLSMVTVEGWGIQMVMMLLMQAAVGWVVARTHRAYQVPFVFLFLICDVLWYAQRNFAWLLGSIDQPEFRLYVVWYFTNSFMLTVGVLLGGILGAGPKTRLSAPVRC